MKRSMTDSKVAWIRNIPSSWHMYKNKYLFDKTKDVVGEEWSKTQLLSLTTSGIKQRSIEDVSGKVPESYNGYQLVRPNQIVMCLFDLDCSAVFSGISPLKGMISPAYIVLNCTDLIDAQFADYWFRFVFDGRKYNTYSKNIRFSLPYEDFKEIFTAVPPLSEQKAIVRYLNKKCTAINETMEKHKGIIEELKEYEQNIISKLIYDTRANEIRLKYLGKVQTGPFGTQLSADEYVDDGTPCINVKNIKAGYLSEYDLDMVPDSVLQRLPVHILQTGDIVFARKGSVDKHAIVSEKECGWMQGSDCIRFRSTKKIIPEYLNYALSASNVKNYLLATANGTTMATLTSDIIKELPIVVPDNNVQGRIADEAYKITKNVSESIERKENIISKLEEYKKSIIYHAVTGKIDCREVQP